jgi:transcriptional regulator with XRE-family HTH domain
MSSSHLSEVERGTVEPSFAMLVSIANTLGADISVRCFAGTGPRIRDRFQAPIVEALMRQVHPAWKRLVEVPVRHPARGVIDAVFARPGELVIATEVHSELRRLEQQLRWAREKADSLPSAESWSMLAAGRVGVRIERLLVLRNTRALRDLAKEFAQTIGSAYPAPTRMAYKALVDPVGQFGGSAVIWCDVDGSQARLLDRPPRGVSLGR